MEFWEDIWGYEAYISQTRSHKTNLKSRQHILRVIIQYQVWILERRKTGTSKVEKGQIPETKNTILYVYTTIMSCWTIFKDRKYNIIDLMYEETFYRFRRYNCTDCINIFNICGICIFVLENCKKIPNIKTFLRNKKMIAFLRHNGNLLSKTLFSNFCKITNQHFENKWSNFGIK
jgi:hypothetical protein